MKNIQVIDGADNCTYDIYAATEAEFDAIFPNGTDVEFSDDLFERLGEIYATEITMNLWRRFVNKRDVNGIHGTLFYQLEHKKKFYPTKKESEMVALGD